MKSTTSRKSTTTTRTKSTIKAPAKKVIINTGVDIVKAITVEQRNSMIAEAAYYIAEKHGFAPGLSEFCWLEAEKQIDSELLKR